MRVNIIKVNAGISSWQFTEINSKRDIDFHATRGKGIPLVPCAVQVKSIPNTDTFADHWRWKPIIDVKSGIIKNWVSGITASIIYKASDDCIIEGYDRKYNTICNNSRIAYVPDFMSPEKEGWNDYIIMDVESNGRIKSWNPENVYSWADDIRRIS